MPSRIRTQTEREALKAALANGPKPARSLASAIKRTRQETGSLLQHLTRAGELERRYDKGLALHVWALPGRVNEPVAETVQQGLCDARKRSPGFVPFERRKPKRKAIVEPARPVARAEVPGWMVRPLRPPGRRKTG